MSKLKKPTMKSQNVSGLGRSSKFDLDLNVIKTKKVKNKESGEMQLLFERIARNMLKEESVKSKLQQEIFCRGLINKLFVELKSEIATSNNATTQQIALLETRISTIKTSIDENESNFKSKLMKLQEDIEKEASDRKIEINDGLEKSFASTKKIMYKERKLIDELREQVRLNSDQYKSLINDLNNDLKVQSMEVFGIRQILDEITSPGRSDQQKEAGQLLEELNIRIKDVENVMFNDLNLHHKHMRDLPSQFVNRDKMPLYAPKSDRQVSKLEENVYDLNTHLRECEAEIQLMKASMKLFLKTHKEVSVDALSRNRRDVCINHEKFSEWDGREEVLALQRKVKKLGENTSRACRSLSGGLSDVQQATLSLYNWSDKAYEAFGTVSNKLNYPVNLCPRAKVYSASNVSDNFNM